MIADPGGPARWPSYRCVFCASARYGRTVEAREMMFGFRQAFCYHECAECGSLQIAALPSDLSRFYPSGYYSFAAKRQPLPQRLLKRLAFALARRRRSRWSRVASRALGVPRVARWLAPTTLKEDAAILDVGSGAGRILFEMRELGFSNLTGIDPLIPCHTAIKGLRILKRELWEVEGKFDLVMFHHSLEHFGDPRAALDLASQVLVGGRYVMIRIPVAGTYAWRHYGANWVQLDAPRHLAIPSEGGMRSLAQACGFAVIHISYDSGAFQFWGSEQYVRDVPLVDPRSYAVDPTSSLFSSTDIHRFKRQAAYLNAKHDGDQACFLVQQL